MKLSCFVECSKFAVKGIIINLMNNATLFHKLAEFEERGEPSALCTVVSSQGSTPRHIGSKMLVFDNGSFIGTVGGGELEHRVIDEAMLAMSEGKARTLAYNMVDPSRGDPGVCGGTVEVFVDPILPPPLLLIIGGGHVGKALAHLAQWLGHRVAVSDDRVEFCNKDAIPDADAFYPVAMADLPKQLNISKQTYIVLTTRGVTIDVPGLPALLDSPAAYLGVIGSKRRWATTVKALREAGIQQEKIDRVHSPMGLELNAETPEEIAVSIMAEIIMIRNSGTGKAMRT
jgi:xanthine dehydrogenase accessory factor